MITTAPSKPAAAWLMLVSRSLLFLLFQLLIAGLFELLANASPWDESARWWPFMAIFANLASAFLLVRLLQSEGNSYRHMLRFSRATVKGDLLWLVGTSLIGLPIAAVPVSTLAVAIFGDSMAPIHMMFRPLPGWAFVLSFLFPLTIPFAELPTYFGYVMPRLAAQLKNGWVAWMICSFFLGAQHVFLPLILDGRFMLWRLGMYLPFAFFAGLLIKLRPSLLPYMAVIHGLVDISALATYLMI